MSTPTLSARLETLEQRIQILERSLERFTAFDAGEAGMSHGLRHHLALLTSEVCVAFGVQARWLQADCRERRICVPRQVIFFIARRRLNLPLAGVGRAFKKDHGTVFHACRAVADRMSVDPEFHGLVTRIWEAVAAKLAAGKTAAPNAAGGAN